MVPEVELLVRAGIPVMGHIGFTPQSEHVLGGYQVQGRGDTADRLVEDALALQEAGCFAVVMEMVPAPLAARVTEVLSIPTIGIGAGPECDAQVLVWQDMAGLRGGKAPRFVKKYADLAASSAGPPPRMPRTSPRVRSRPASTPSPSRVLASASRLVALSSTGELAHR